MNNYQLYINSFILRVLIVRVYEGEETIVFDHNREAISLDHIIEAVVFYPYGETTASDHVREAVYVTMLEKLTHLSSLVSSTV